MRINPPAFGNDCQNQKKAKKTMGFSSLCLLEYCMESADGTEVKKPGSDTALAQYFLLSGLPQNTARNR